MTLLFVDSFDHYVTADQTKKWTSVYDLHGLYHQIEIGTGRRGTNCTRLPHNGGMMNKTLGFRTTWILGFAFKYTNLTYNMVSQWAVGLYNPLQKTRICGVKVNPDGSLSIVRTDAYPSNTPDTVLGTTDFALNADEWYYIEFKCEVAQSISSGGCSIRVNGVEQLSLAAASRTGSQILSGVYLSDANSVRIGAYNPGTQGSQWFDDLYVCDTAGTTNNDFLGDCRVDVGFPTLDGYYTQFTPSTGSDHYPLVDETAPNTTDYVSSVTLNHRDSYVMTDLPAISNQVIYGVQVNACAIKDDAGLRVLNTMVRSNSTDEDGPGFPISDQSYLYVHEIFEEDPDTSAAWVESGVNAMEAGVRVKV